MALESVFLGLQDLSPSINEQILISLKLLLFSLQALRSGYKPALEALLLDGILRHSKFFVAEAHLIFGEIHYLFIRASLPILPPACSKLGWRDCFHLRHHPECYCLLCRYRYFCYGGV